MRTLVKYLTAALLLPALALSASAQSASSLLEGGWNGKISVGQTELTLVFNFQPTEDGSLTATMDSPDQGAEGIEAELDASALPSVGVKVPSLSATFSGMLYRGSIVGSFSQNGLSFPLTLTRGKEVLNRPQTPQPPFPYRTEEVSFTNAAAGATLAGTLSWPVGCGLSIYGDAEGTAPAAVVMVSGSGQQNRDEEIFGHKPFLVIADHLARNGIASLRYDDRGFGESSGGDVENATTEDFMQDALAVDFVVSLAGPGVRGDRALTAQVNRIMELSGQPGMVSEEMYRQNVRLEGNSWLRWFIDYDPSDDIAATGCPVMAVNGSRDCQVISSLNLAAIQVLLPPNERNFIKEYDSLNHLFQHCTTGVPTEYRSIEETVSPELLSDLSSWLTANFLP